MKTIHFNSQTHEALLEQAENILANDKLPEWERDIWTFIQSFLNPEIKQFSIFTSGSTGKPKLIKHTRIQLEQSANATLNRFNMHEGNHALLALPAKHIGGRMMIVRSIIGKLSLSYVPLSAKPLNGITVQDKFDFAALTPMQLANCLNDTTTQKKANNISKIILGGGEVSSALLTKIQMLNCDVYHTYGMTETASHVAVKKLKGDDASDVFYALPNVTFSTTAEGCLVIHAPLFSKEDFITTDVVNLSSPTAFVWKGRADNVINSGGLKFQAENLEQKLHHAIAQRFFFAAEKDDLLGEKIVLVIEATGFDEKQHQQLQKTLTKNLTKHEMPKRIAFLGKFRETESGKLMRAESLKIAH